MIGLYIGGGALSLALVFFIVYLVLIAPVRNKRIDEFKSVLYAHRGLHGNGRAENSMSAFLAAVEAGYGIELDIRLSSDGELVVFHDDTLNRVAGVDGRVDAYTAEQLGQMRLNGTDDGVPTFRDVLAAIDGRVPLLVEIKEDQGSYKVSDAAAEMLKDYNGKYIVESFNPLSLGNFAKKLPEVPRGILSQNYQKDEKYRALKYRLLGALLLNRVCKPCFIAYDHRDSKRLSLRIVRRLFGAATLAWTVRSPEEERAARDKGFDSVIFENYLA